MIHAVRDLVPRRFIHAEFGLESGNVKLPSCVIPLPQRHAAGFHFRTQFLIGLLGIFRLRECPRCQLSLNTSFAFAFAHDRQIDRLAGLPNFRRCGEPLDFFGDFDCGLLNDPKRKSRENSSDMSGIDFWIIGVGSAIGAD